MNTAQKQEVIELLKEKFSQYSNFYLTDTESLSVEQINNLRRACFSKNVEMKVAKNTMIKKAMESIDADKYSGLFDSLKGVTALMFSDTPKEPAVIISTFRDQNPGDRPILKAALIDNADLFVGDNQLSKLKSIKTKNELIGEVISLLQSPISRVISALENKPEEVTKKEEASEEAAAPSNETPTEETPKTEEKPAEENPTTDETPAAE